MTSSVTYVVRTDLPPERVTAIGLEVFRLWMDFALGRGTVNGRRVVYPTGRYAASLSMQRDGEAVVVAADESVAPEVAILESGHMAVDLKTKLQHGRAYPMHRAPGSTPGTSLLRIGSGPPGKPRIGVGSRGVAAVRRPMMYANLRASTASGFASIGSNSTGWIIPAMPAYAPAATLARMAASMK